ncbi:neurexin-1 isoform X1 [Pieris brassicae]|uniref:neurexin-1 isoform X1 n=1 Tax=Pieris brassicae TaxID=7116 RepID=UPI001E660D1C|nr:neurexin-1 isoform X1 [Pieris brassicae]XP_045527568.1 neurexin-1 isoform X1 [Pieris brassicae]
MYLAIRKMRYFLFCLLSLSLHINFAFVLDKQNPYSQFKKWNAGLNGTLELEFKTDQPNGLLLYTDDGGTYDFFELKLVNSALRLRYNLGGGAQIITVGSNLNDGHWHKVQVARRDEHTSLTVDGSTQSKTSRGKEFIFGKFNSNSDVFVGGIPASYNAKLTALALPSVIFEPKFRGAVRNLVYSDIPGQPPRRQELRHSRDLKSSRINASGDACERRDPCQHGGVCISTDDGPICECRDGDYEGAFCERDKAPSEATFRGAEFLSYDLTQTGGEPIVSTQDAISLYFKTRQPNGLLFYTGHEADYLNLAVRDGGVSLTMGLGNGKQEMHIKPSKTRFDDHQWHKLTVRRKIQEITPFTSFCRVSAVVDDVYSEHAHVAGSFTMLASSRAHVGGSLNTRALPGARVHTNFIGCLKKVEFSADTLRLNLIDLARTGSKLITVTGRLEYACTATDSADPVTFSTKEAHLILPKWEAVKTGTISFKFRTNEPNGLILFNMGAKPPRVGCTADLFAVEMLNGYIYVHVDLGSGGVRVRASRRRVDDSHWHEFLLRRTGRDGRVTVDGANAEFKTPGESNQLELDGPLFVGGLGSEYSAARTPPALWTAALRQGFVGCIRDLVLNGKPQDLTAYARQQDSASVRPACHVLMKQCVSSPCQHGGICSEGWNRPLCDCSSTNYGGPTCGRESPTIFLNGSQHMTASLGLEHVTQTEELLLRFKTSKAGLLLRTASENSADRIELAVAAGRVRASVRLGDREKNLLAGTNVADSLWHTVRFSRRASNLKLQVDGGQPVRGTLSETILGKASTLEISSLHLGGLFHPEEEIQMTSTLPNFVGYLQNFIFNGIKYIDLAKTLGIGTHEDNNNLYDTSNIIFNGKFTKPDSLNVYKAVTFKSKHTYAGLPLLKAYANTYVDFYFRTTEMDGLLFYNGGKKQDFIAVELVNGHIHCVFNLGDGVVTMKDKLKNFLNDNRWHAVSIRRPTPKVHTLQVDDDLELHTTSSNLMLELDSVLYVGGVPKDMYTLLPVGVLSRQGFEGCMSSLDLPGESPSLLDDVVVPSSSLVSGCEGPTKCTHNACANKGVCVQQWNTYVCDCDLTSFTGPTCYDESIAYEFGPGRGIITYSFSPSAVTDTETDKVAVGFVTSKADAVILRIESSNTQDYMQMEIIRGNLFFVYNVGDGEHPVGDEAARVDDGAYHVASFTRNGSRAALQLDNYAVNLRHPQGGQQSTVFNSMSKIIVGGGSGGARSFNGVLAGLVAGKVRVLDLAAAGDPAVTVRGDARRAQTPLDRDINRMQQTPPSGYAGPGVLDELVYSGAGSGCRDDDEDACVLPDAGSGDDLITPVYVPSTRRPPAMRKGNLSGKLMKPCDDEDCIEGSGSNGEEITEPEHPITTGGVSSTASMTSPTTSIATDHVEKAISGFTEGGTESAGTTKSDRTTLPDHDNMHAGTVDTASTPEKGTTPTEEDTHTSNQFTPTVTRHTEPAQTTEEEIPDYEDHTHTKMATRSPYGIDEVVPGSYPGYNGHEPEITTKWYHPKSTDNRVVPPESEFFATIVGIVASVLIAIIIIVIIVLKLMFKLDPSYKVTEDKSYQQSASAALLANQAHSSYQTGSNVQTGGAVRNLQPLPLNRNGASPLAPMPQPVKRDGIKEWYV